MVSREAVLFAVALVCAVGCLPADPALPAELTIDDLRAALDSSASVHEASAKLRSLLRPQDTRRSALLRAKAWPVDELDTGAVSLLQMEEPHIFAPKIGWNDPDTRPKTMSAYCEEHYGCGQEATAEGKKDSREARQGTRKAERALRKVKRQSARTIRHMKRQESKNFAESLKYGVKAKTDKLSTELTSLKKKQAIWQDEKLMCDSKMLQFKQMNDKLTMLKSLQSDLEKKSRTLANEETKVANLEGQVKELQGVRLDGKIARKIGQYSKKNKFFRDALEKVIEDQTAESKLKAAITGTSRTAAETRAKAEIQKAFTAKSKHLTMKEKGAKLSMKVHSKERALAAEEATVETAKEADEVLEKAREDKLSELKVKASLQGKASTGAENKAKKLLRATLAARATADAIAAKRAEVSGRALVEKHDDAKRLPAEAKLEQQREKEVSEASEKTAVKKKDQTPDERASKKDVKKAMKRKEKKMAFNVGVKEMQSADQTRKKEIAATEKEEVKLEKLETTDDKAPQQHSKGGKGAMRVPKAKGAMAQPN